MYELWYYTAAFMIWIIAEPIGQASALLAMGTPIYFIIKYR